jgi:murein DD-endopeptidase MepM/ murein hydrolase activator NlpD
MKKFLVIALILNINFIAKAELEIDLSNKYTISAEAIKISKNGIVLGEYSNNFASNPYNGLYLDNSGNFSFTSKALGSYKITDIDEDEQNYYASSYMSLNYEQGVFKVSKDFKNITNIGVKAATKKVHVYKDKVYTGGYTHGSYVVNKDGSNLTQILGDGYFGPQIDDIKSNSKNVYILSRGNLYKVNYENNQKEQIITGQRPSFIEIDEDRIYLAAYNKFFYLDFNNVLSNEKTFINKINYMKKFKDIIILVETDYFNNYFWISSDNGKNFFKSKTQIPASSTIKEIEILGENSYTLYFNIANQGIVKGKLILDFEDKKLFDPPFKTSSSNDLFDKITAFFDHRYPYLGNKTEPDEYKNTTLNFQGKELEEPYIYYSSHDGIDWGLPINSSIYSVADGIATYFFDQNGLGHAIKIEHDNKYITIYGHLSEDDLVTKDTAVKVVRGQKIGKVGMSGNTSGPHLHFTTYYGEKNLTNKIDPFGWKGKFNDPWSSLAFKSDFLWKDKTASNLIQLNPSDKKIIQKDKVNIEVLNLSFISSPLNLEIEGVPPIYNLRNYQYKFNTSYNFILNDFESKNISSSILGIISFSGFEFGEDKKYSIWKVSGNSIDKQTTVYNQASQSLSTLFEPSATYLVLKDSYKKISIKSNVISK